MTRIDSPDAGALAADARPVPSPTRAESDSRALASDLSSRLAEAVARVTESLTRGARLCGHTLPDGFALERANNIVAGLIDLFDPDLGQ